MELLNSMRRDVTADEIASSAACGVSRSGAGSDEVDAIESGCTMNGMTDDTPEARRARLRPPETYSTVGEWYADYRGFVPIQMAHGLSRYIKQHGCTFAEAYRALRERGAIIEIEQASDET